MSQDAGRTGVIETVACTILDAERDFAEDDFREDPPGTGERSRQRHLTLYPLD